MNFLFKYFKILFLVLLAIAFILIHFSAKSSKNSHFDRFIDKMGIVVGIFIAVSVILTYHVFRETLEQNARDTTFKIVDRGWLNVNKSLLKYYILL